ncbi:GNAT family N-acetyltransferase [Enterococcus sp. 5H]|uniref:GNAT family N-acetyltransferase n=1 Tax=Enterococcus sp. 5H TaxID=1229490 RepID=UPI00230258AC|nr:GNAT family N-acetyltransferase [Enterococcus sp. 5H]MDA9471712.1 hypothetical protein [Enterococcus sp. 5H]
MSIKEIQYFTTFHYELLLLADPDKNVINKYLPRGISFEYRSADDVAGVLVLLPTRPETLEIVNIAVSEAFQNQGIGAKLLHFAIDYAKENSYKTVEIGTGSTSFAQLYLYQKCGFRLTSIDRDFFVRHYDEEIIENKLVLKDMVRLSLDL